MKYEFHYGAASVSADFHEGLGLVELRGPVTGRVITQARLEIAAVQPGETCVYLWCWDRAALAYDLRTQSAVNGGDWRLADLVVLPAGNLVTEGQYDDFDEYAVDAINRGLVRVTFLQRELALAWAARKIVFSPRQRAPAARRAQLVTTVRDCQLEDFRHIQ